MTQSEREHGNPLQAPDLQPGDRTARRIVCQVQEVHRIQYKISDRMTLQTVERAGYKKDAVSFFFLVSRSGDNMFF